MTKSLAEDLQTPKASLTEFKDLTLRILGHLPNVITSKEEKRGYVIYSSVSGLTKKFVRPIKQELFIFDPRTFAAEFELFLALFAQLKAGQRDFPEQAYTLIDRIVYTIQQGIGAGLDLLVEANSGRKHVGNRFEELVRLLVTELGVANKKVVLKIPYDTDEGRKTYSCETDLIFSPFDKVNSSSTHIDPREVVVSLKITSKDRMSKIFIDKILLEKFAGHKKVKHVGIFFNDVQRKESNDISFTFVPGLFLVYTQFLAQLDGIYYIDLPPRTKQAPYDRYLFPFSKFFIKDIWILLTP